MTNLLFNIEQSLFDSGRLRLIRLITHKLGLAIIATSVKFLFNRLEFEAVESVDVVLGEVLKLGLACHTDTCVVLLPNQTLAEGGQVFQGLELLLILTEAAS